jgi:predicted phage tail protein
MRIQGSKGSGGSTPTQSPDSLHSIAYARVLDVLSEGPIYGLVSGLQSVYLDGTPIQNSDGSYNFTNYTVDSRTGTQDQDYLPGFPAVESEVAVGAQLTSDAPWVHAVSNTQLTAVRVRFGVPALQRQDASSGDVTGYRVEYAIDLAIDGGAYSQVVSGAFDGKTTSLYERSVRIDLPEAATGWLVRVRRITPNAHSSSIADAVNIEAITEVIDRKLRYPMTALVGMSFDAQHFGSVPTRSYDVKGLLIKVPSNYDPDLRIYAGTWDGTFKIAWSNNPAWVFYDIVLNSRYGLGDRVDASMLDKWGLYQIGQYCDVMVSDGKGGQEPRFTCNCAIQSQADAYKVLQDLATTFRGIAYWGPGAVVASSDMPADPVYVYTAANVVNGVFDYAGSARKARYTVALVSWNDPANSYKQAVEPVPDEDGISRYGINKAQITAFGTTSQGQAHRLGLWTLITSRYETNTVSFSVGLDGTLCAPGQIIAIADPAKAGRRMGGRLRSVNGVMVTLDKAPTAGNGDKLTVILPSGLAQSRSVQSVSGDVIQVNAAFDANPVSGAIWMLENTDLASQLFRVVSIQEASDNGQVTYTVNAIQHEPGKYAAIDDGAQIQARPITVVPPSVQAPPTNVRLSTYSTIDQGISKTTAVIAWDAAANAVNYTTEWRKDNGDWVPANPTGGLQVEVQGIYQGTYDARVRAVNAMGVASIPAYSSSTSLTGKTSPPPTVSGLSATTSLVFAIEVDWSFPDGAGDTAYTEIYYSHTADFASATPFGRYSYPTNKAELLGLAAGYDLYFWARLVDTTGNIGAWYPDTASAGAHGQSSSDATTILAYLTEQITETQLAQALLSKIDSGAGAVAQADAITSELAAMYTIKTALVGPAGRTYMAGIGVGVENDNGIIESQVLVAASRFAVLDPNGTALASPFVIQGGQVFIDQAFIGTAWIDNAKIADAAITTAKIVDGHITSAKIADASITNAKIGDAEITTAKIGTAQIDTLRIGGNAVTTLANWGFSGISSSGSASYDVGYGASGGDMLVFVNATCGQEVSTESGTVYTSGHVNVYLNGALVASVSNNAGLQVTAFGRIAGLNGSVTVHVDTLVASNISVAIFEAKR